MISGLSKLTNEFITPKKSYLAPKSSLIVGQLRKTNSERLMMKMTQMRKLKILQFLRRLSWSWRSKRRTHSFNLFKIKFKKVKTLFLQKLDQSI
jgi:hypothetical protein